MRSATAVAEHAATHHVHVLDTDIAADGGKYYLAAGAPTSTERDEENLLRATLAVLADQSPLRLRAGINRGRVFSGVIGGPTRRAYTCLGDAVNLAARLCARAPDGTALVTCELLSHVRASTDVEVLPPIMVKGKTVPIEAAIVRSIGPRPADVDLHVVGVDDGPLVGRDVELAHLVALANRARDGHGAAVVVTGEPGIGKSRLFDELASVSGLPCVWTASDPYQVNTPYAAIRRVLRPLLGIADDADDGDAVARLTELGRRATGVHGLLSLAGLAVGVTMPSTPEVADISPAFLGATLQRVVLALLDGRRTRAVADHRRRRLLG